jgi:hypothetical protein
MEVCDIQIEEKRKHLEGFWGVGSREYVTY